MKQPHILAIGSFAVHGTASLKTFISILGEKILPVPSLLLNGLTNMGMVKKFEPPFDELLKSTFELAEFRKLDLVLYIGYLGNANQVDVIMQMIQQYKSIIKTIIIDPVCGDHGLKYVPNAVIECWPRLIVLADMVFPNMTELKILTDNPQDAQFELDWLKLQFEIKYPKTKLIITSITTNEDNIGFEVAGDGGFTYMHALLPKNYGGTGDAFLAQFILNYFYKNTSFNAALKLAADQTFTFIENSIAKTSDDLILEP